MHKIFKFTLITAVAILAAANTESFAEPQQLGVPVQPTPGPQPAIRVVAQDNPNPQQQPSPETVANAQDQVLLTVNNQQVTNRLVGAYFSERLQKSPDAKLTPQLQNMMLNEIVNIVLLSQVAKQNHLDTDPDTATVLNLQRDMLLSKMVLQGTLAKLAPTPEELQAIYTEQYSAPSEQYKAAHILLKTKEEAQNIIGKLAQGADFAQLAKDNSKDSNASIGGDLGWVEASQMVKPFADALVIMTPGAYSTAPVQTQFGWHVIFLSEKRTNAPPEFATVKPRLVEIYQHNKLSEYVAQLRKQAAIEINQPGPTGAPAPK